MLERTSAAGAGLLMLCGPALAVDQSSTSSGNPGSSQSQTSSAQNQTAQSLPQELSQKLQRQGFSDVRIVPGSFIVSARDRNGDPVSMVIGPRSMTMFVASSAGTDSTTGSSANPTTGSGNNMQNNNGSSAK